MLSPRTDHLYGSAGRGQKSFSLLGCVFNSSYGFNEFSRHKITISRASLYIQYIYTIVVWLHHTFFSLHQDLRMPRISPCQRQPVRIYTSSRNLIKLSGVLVMPWVNFHTLGWAIPTASANEAWVCPLSFIAVLSRSAKSFLFLYPHLKDIAVGIFSK